MNQTTSTSPFHPGEQWLQARVGEREKVEALGQRVIRNYMPEQHRRFYAGLEMLVVGTVDDDGWPWSTVIPGRAGFVTATDEKTLVVRQKPNEMDRASPGLQVGHVVGILGIDLSTRRRNRLNGRIIVSDGAGFAVAVDQSFGNCPQYIQKREAHRVDAELVERHSFNAISSDAARFIQGSDTFFVASFVEDEAGVANAGVDVSHRGGRPGFVHVDDSVLTIPDFRGNQHFNTLGNFVLNPKAGLVFPDFVQGRLLQLAGRVELLDVPPTQFEGAERAWRVEVDRGQWLEGALPYRFSEPEWSPRTVRTGNWL
jgi:predicted pyridoxine 5'-phosphate oxidase superfamily flavin-nucleotide-binding protein